MCRHFFLLYNIQCQMKLKPSHLYMSFLNLFLMAMLLALSPSPIERQHCQQETGKQFLDFLYVFNFVCVPTVPGTIHWNTNNDLIAPRPNSSLNFSASIIDLMSCNTFRNMQIDTCLLFQESIFDFLPNMLCLP